MARHQTLARSAVWGLVAAACLAGSAARADELQRFRVRAGRVIIQRDDWGIPHIHGETDSDAVFGMMYAQAEDDFGRIEMNYLTALGRSSEADGPTAIWQDLRQRLFVDPVALRLQYRRSPAWLKELMRGWADGLNFYLATHTGAKPRVLSHFEPWMALSFTEGSIGGDVAKVSLAGLQNFYSAGQSPPAPMPRQTAASSFVEPAGSNGAAIGPSDSASGHSLLLINPHTSFYFRSEAQVSSDAGLNAYGASTWGQFFVYQGFNAHAGWMHTTSTADAVDEFAETVVERRGKLLYRYGRRLLPITRGRFVLRYRTISGTLADRVFDVLRTRHGPIVRVDDGRWIATALMNRPVAALSQSFLRTKATDLPGFLTVAKLAANSSNNTLFADDKGETAFLLPQFLPRRDDRFDYTKPVDGSDPATDWNGVLPFSEIPHVLNPVGGWVDNVNDGPWWAAGSESPRRVDFPRYVDQAGANARTPHAMREFGERHGLSLDTLTAAAFDSWMPTFDCLVPNLLSAYDGDHDAARRERLREPVAALRGWDRRWGYQSVSTSVAIFWAEALWAKVNPPGATTGRSPYEAIETASASDSLAALDDAVARLRTDFGRWQVPWGEINRFQRLDDAIVPRFDDSRPSVPIPFAYAQWGSLASFGARRYDNTRRYYGTSGNSFVAVVEFGPRVRARAIMAGGQSGDPSSKHFSDQAQRYADGALRDVYFHPDELRGHVERTYHPGEQMR